MGVHDEEAPGQQKHTAAQLKKIVLTQPCLWRNAASSRDVWKPNCDANWHEVCSV